MDTSVHWKIAGRSGEGIDITGVMFGKLAMRQGMNVFTYREYPSLIRGGHSTHQVHASFGPVTSQQKHIQLLIAFNEEGIALHQDEIGPDSVVLCEATQDGYDLQKYLGIGATFYDFPMTNISREETGHFLAQNVVALGASAWVLGMDLEILKSVISDQFAEKGEEMIAKNHRAMYRGYEYAKEHFKQLHPPFETRENTQILLTGNHAVALGAISAGVQYFSAYPMTPTSEILHSLAAAQFTYPIVVKHAEDEISAINQAIGASYTGVRAMTASATGGFALMVEATSLAAVMETPLVICVGQRPGPATGLPTWTCQSDLHFIIHAGHGENPKVVFTPANGVEHFALTRLAFEIAERLHMTVFVLSDKLSLESYATMPAPDTLQQNQRFGFVQDPLPEDDSYRRFADTNNGMSPRSVPGQPHGLSITNSYEHDEFGYATESAELTKKMNARRQQKMSAVLEYLPAPKLLGNPEADVTLIGWGSTGLVLDTIVQQSNGKFNAIHIQCVWPFPTQQFQELTKNAKKLVMIEGNATGQMQQLIRQETGIEIPHAIRRFDGRPFFAQEVIAELQEMEKTW